MHYMAFHYCVNSITISLLALCNLINPSRENASRCIRVGAIDRWLFDHCTVIDPCSKRK